MDDVQNRLAREVAAAIAAAVAGDTDVESCRERSRAAGFEMSVSLEATLGFSRRRDPDGPEIPPPAEASVEPLRAFEVSPNDRRFLRSLRIAADEVKVEETN